MKEKFKILTVITIIGLTFISTAIAEHCQSDNKSKRGGRHGNFEQKLMHKVKMCMLFKDELKLSNIQQDKLKTLKVALKKDSIKKQAKIEELKIDIKSLLHEDNFDINEVNGLIDSKYEIKKAKTKFVVDSIAQFNHILKNDQLDELENIIHDHVKQFMDEGSHPRFWRR